MERTAKHVVPGYGVADPDKVVPAVRQAINEAIDAREFPILLYGDVGSGKTCAAAGLFGKQKRRPLWYRADDLLVAMAVGRAGTIDVDAPNIYGEIERRPVKFCDFQTKVQRAAWMFLDDLGLRGATDPMKQALFDLLEWRQTKPLVITSNLSIPELAELYDDRIASRIQVGSRIRFGFADRRTRGKLTKCGD